MNAYQIVLKSGTIATVYTPRNGIDNSLQKGCPLQFYDSDLGTLHLDLTLNQQNQIEWIRENQETIVELSAQNEDITTQLYQQIYPQALEDAKAALRNSGLVKL